MYALTYRRGYFPPLARKHGEGSRHAREHGPEVKNILGRQQLQTQLTLGAPGDRFEQEADRVADQVMRMPVSGTVGAGSAPPRVQRLCSECEEELRRQPVEEEDEEMLRASPAAGGLSVCGGSATPLVQRMCPECEEEVRRQPEEEEEEELLQASAARGGLNPMSPGLARSIQSLRGGRPLAAEERGFFEPRFGRDFSQVRIHTGNAAARISRAINARAFTVGHNVVFGKGEYAPQTSAGRRLLGHELTHVLQQRQAQAPATIQRACGRREIGPTPDDCNVVSKPPVGTRYLFRSGCDVFADGQRERLERVVSTLPAGAAVEILGLASSDGREDFNESLSCRRAEAAEAVFADAGKLGNVARVEATGEVPGTDYDANYRAVDIVVHGPPSPTEPPSPPPSAPPTPVSPPPRIPVASCPCPGPASCPPTYCAAMWRPAAVADRFARGPALIGVVTGLGGASVGAIYNRFVWGGLAGIMTLSGALASQFATICQTAVATNHIMNEIINSIWGRYPASTPAHIIPLTTVAGTAVADIDTPGNPRELVYCGATNAPGLLAGGVGKTQLTTRVGAIPSPQNDARLATGQVDVSRFALPGGGTRLVFTPTVDIEVKDTVDFCPGNCGGAAARVATVPFSRWEATGISGDVAFVTSFPAPRSQLRKIVLESVGGVDRWRLEPI